MSPESGDSVDSSVHERRQFKNPGNALSDGMSFPTRGGFANRLKERFLRQRRQEMR